MRAKPTSEEFYFSSGLYEQIYFDENDFEYLFNLVFFSRRIDLYCLRCKKETTFECHPRREKKDTSFQSESIYTFNDFKEKFGFEYFRNKEKFEISFKCIREPYSNHTIYFQMLVENSSIFKIGQYPSVADLSSYDLERYQKTLDRKDFSELKKAVGLFSHGIGIGSFVYLRRIFERLIQNNFEIHKNELNIEYNNFLRMKMDKKIDILREYLPAILVEKKALYGILSKGIHHLDEDTCKEYFPIVRAGIEFILDEQIIDRDKKEKMNKYSKDFNHLIRKEKE